MGTVVTFPLPAHRFERRKKMADARVIVFDLDETITKSPNELAYLAKLAHKDGCKIVVLTGNQSPRHELEDRLKDYGFPYDELVQYHDSESDGLIRAEYLRQFGAWLAFDNRIDRAPTYTKVCPHLFMVTGPTKAADDEAKGTKKDAKKAAKDIGLRAENGPTP